MAWNTGEIRDVVAKRASDLAHLKCPCGCPETVFAAACHRTTLVRTAYDSQEKCLLIACGECNALVAKIRVAD